MIYLIGTLLVLLTGWLLFGWFVGESSDIRWLKHWCSVLFVSMAVVLCLSGGAFVTHRITTSSHRKAVQELAAQLNQRMKEGRTADVRDAISFLANPPDERSNHSPDILRRLEELRTALRETSPAKQTQTATNANLDGRH
ncbi:MAG: hypothetical protein U0996_02205 [Planctomycetaceae bacterium]